MKKLLSWKSLALVLLAVMGISLSILLAQPSQATSANYQRMIELGFIDEVKSPEELGLGYLCEGPPERTGSLIDRIRYTRDLAETQMSDNIAYSIPLGSNAPFAVGQLRNDDGGTLNSTNIEATGYSTRSGQPEPFTGRDTINMFTEEVRNDGSFDVDSVGSCGSKQTVVTDASSSFLQARRIAVIDLIVRDKRNSKYYLLPNIRVDSFCRDALNSVYNRTYRRFNGNLRRLRA
ncbi:MAG: hypothetical protein F6K21_19085 [Symploca sp. SIO2D2]|nr:hypothetical protein [Symploca sp. SIO2D2]